MSLPIATINSWLRVWRTARHLRGSQIAHRLARIASQRFRVPPRYEGEISRSACQPIDSCPAVPEFSRGCVAGSQLTTQLEQGQLRLVNRTLPFTFEAPDWRLGQQDDDRLWAITLHYHGWLYELGKICRADSDPDSPARKILWTVLNDWLATCHLGNAGVETLAWNSYAIATRLGWWARLWDVLGAAFWERHIELADAFLYSMHAQAIHLESHLEWDLRANHLLRDAVGLAWAGRFFQGETADRWLRQARDIALQQATEQMLDDGGHFERSPFYHLEVMDDWQTLARLLPDDQSATVMRSNWLRGAEYIRWMCHPDGRVAQFNDGAAAFAAPHLEIEGGATGTVEREAPRGGRWFADSGVIAWHGDPWTIFWDVGNIGPDYQPGHAHADTLTIEASYEGRRLIVDPGCHSYDNNGLRQYDRSTAAHNTVCIDEQDSSEVWHIFRVGRRAHPLEVQTSMTRSQLWGRASHNGYDHLPGRPRHTRTVVTQDAGELQLEDRITGRGRHTVQGGLLIAPGWQMIANAEGWQLQQGETNLQIHLHCNARLETSVQSQPVHADYGCSQVAQRACWSYQGELPLRVTIRITPR